MRFTDGDTRPPFESAGAGGSPPPQPRPIVTVTNRPSPSTSYITITTVIDGQFTQVVVPTTSPYGQPAGVVTIYGRATTTATSLAHVIVSLLSVLLTILATL